MIYFIVPILCFYFFKLGRSSAIKEISDKSNMQMYVAKGFKVKP